MATSDSSTTDTGGNYLHLTPSGSTSSEDYGPSWTSSSSSGYWARRSILVKMPKKWGRKKTKKFCKLVNEKTNTGWKCMMTIKGKVKIHDPHIERMKLKDFIPILKRRANNRDEKIINKFVENNLKLWNHQRNHQTK